MRIPDIESLVGRVEDFLAEIESGEKSPLFRKGRATTLRREIAQAISDLRQALAELRLLGQKLDQIVQEANKSNGTSLPTTALT